jgi:hypothetical protein
VAKNIKPTRTTYLALVSLKHNRAGDMRVELSSADKNLVLEELDVLSIKRNKDVEPGQERPFRSCRMTALRRRSTMG